MSTKHGLDERVYTSESGRTWSMRDLLQHFASMGSLRVSDLHLKAGVPPAYRVDGDLEQLQGPPLAPVDVERMVSALLTDEELARLEREHSLDSSLIEQDLQFRINCYRDTDGLCAAVRALESAPPPVEEVGFPNGVWRDIIARRSGLVLVTGVTGAGKSTTIASLIDRIVRTTPCRVITLEDPIEYRLRSGRGIISQREVGRDVASFERGLRDALREDPDVIFVGEMRDRESASWTMTAAETGHLVFSTLHTRNAAGSITRLLDMYPPERKDEVANQLSLGLAYVISQKLIPRSDGKGRVVAMEILNNSYAVQNLIRTGKIEQLYSQQQTRTRDVPEERMCTMERSLAVLVGQGRVAPLEAEKWAGDPGTFLDELRRIGAGAAR